MRIGIIGGTGLDEALGVLAQGEARMVETPFGLPSAPIRLTEVDGVPLALLARHGEGHVFSPSRVPYRANIFALKKLGVTHILATGAVGSLREEIVPRDLVVADQVIDRTFRRPATFFEELAVHVELAAPFCPWLRSVLLEAGQGLGVRVHRRGTYVCMEGPQLSTRAESEMNRLLGGDLIGMTAMPEAKLAREAEICYALVALPTDYDCWRTDRGDADSAEVLPEVIANLNAVTQSALALMRGAIPRVGRQEGRCRCSSALANAIWSDARHLSAEAWEKLSPLLARAAVKKPA